MVKVSTVEGKGRGFHRGMGERRNLLGELGDIHEIGEDDKVKGARSVGRGKGGKGWGKEGPRPEARR